ncbi:MAG: 30S ribosomal protein S5 [Nanoarchaeota archaeon]
MPEEVVLVKEVEKEQVPRGVQRTRSFDPEKWQPKTELGRKVKNGEIKSIDEILNSGLKILEPEIIDFLLPNLESDLFLVGQSRGKFGGGKRTIWRQTQKKTSEGNKPKFATLAIVGNKDGYVGIGFGKSRETMPAREKSIREAKLNVIKVRRGCGSWECGSGKEHSIPFKITGKSGSVLVILIPAPKGTKLCIEKECQKIMNFAGIKDIYSKTSKSKTKLNLIKACFYALKNLSSVKVKQHSE